MTYSQNGVFMDAESLFGFPESIMVADAMSIEMVAKNQILFKEGTPSKRFYGVLGGQVALIAQDSGNVVELLGPGSFFGEEALFGGDRLFSAKVLSCGRIAVLDPEKFLSSDGSLEGLTRFALRRLAERQGRLVRETVSLKSTPPLQRLARLLLSLPDAQSGQAKVKLPWTKRVMAERIGVRPETFSRLLPGLPLHGARVEGDWIVFTDTDALRAFANGEPGQKRLRKSPSRDIN